MGGTPPQPKVSHHFREHRIGGGEPEKMTCLLFIFPTLEPATELPTTRYRSELSQSHGQQLPDTSRQKVQSKDAHMAPGPPWPSHRRPGQMGGRPKRQQIQLPGTVSRTPLSYPRQRSWGPVGRHWAPASLGYWVVEGRRALEEGRRMVAHHPRVWLTKASRGIR